MTTISIDTTAIRTFCERHHVRKLALFGSALRGALSAASDVDLLVEFESEHVPGFFGLIEMENELSALLGRRADLRTLKDLSRYFRSEVARDAETLYEAC
jgi:hypothetical protein